MLGVVVAGDSQVQFGKKIKGGEEKPQNSLGSDCCLALAHVLAPEQKLSVQVAHVDRVEIHDLDLSEARQDQDLAWSENELLRGTAGTTSRKQAWTHATNKVVNATLRSSQPMPPAPTTSTLESATAHPRPRM